jgi:hypothetical protein
MMNSVILYYGAVVNLVILVAADTVWRLSTLDMPGAVLALGDNIFVTEKGCDAVFDGHLTRV